jgi:DNA-binding transcriptional MerR regulator
MPTDAYTPAAAAAIIGVSPSTLRNWAAQFSRFLSPGATPSAGADRVLTGADVAILQRVKELRERRKSYEDIASELEAMPTELSPYIDVQPSAEPLQQPTAPLQPVTGTDTALQVLALVDSRYSEIQRQMEGLRSAQVDRLTWFVWGFLCGLITVLIVLAILWTSASLAQVR